jgi:catechol 2,3-dioxygenase-like lactoylglutathione lyase family enzyme
MPGDGEATMIRAAHVLIYSKDAAADRAFLRDVLGWPYVEDEPGSGWLIFKLPPGELGVHPGGEPVHELSLVCDDIDATVAELTGKGVEFIEPIVDAGFGRITKLRLPGGGGLQLYQPMHTTAYDL